MYGKSSGVQSNLRKTLMASRDAIQGLLPKLTETIMSIPGGDHHLFLRKQECLEPSGLDIPRESWRHTPDVFATLVFAQEEIGITVCILAEVLRLTCSHCVTETRGDPETSLAW